MKAPNPNVERKIRRTHERVLELGKHAETAARAGDKKGSLRRAREAFKMARRNADLVRGMQVEPARSKLHLVAAAFAMDCGKYDQVIELIDRAREGNPPDKVETDLAKLRQAAMRARINSNGDGNGTGDTAGAGTVERDDGGAGLGADARDESGDCTGSETQCEHREPLQERNL